MTAELQSAAQSGLVWPQQVKHPIRAIPRDVTLLRTRGFPCSLGLQSWRWKRAGFSFFQSGRSQEVCHFFAWGCLANGSPTVGSFGGSSAPTEIPTDNGPPEEPDRKRRKLSKDLEETSPPPSPPRREKQLQLPWCLVFHVKTGWEVTFAREERLWGVEGKSHVLKVDSLKL